MNRISNYFEKEPEELYGDFYVVVGEFGYAYVTSETAKYVEAALDRRWVPKWVVFRDRAGSRLRVRTRLIRAIWENTAAQRAIDRQLDRARQLEEKADRRPWEDD